MILSREIPRKPSSQVSEVQSQRDVLPYRPEGSLVASGPSSVCSLGIAPADACCPTCLPKLRGGSGFCRTPPKSTFSGRIQAAARSRRFVHDLVYYTKYLLRKTYYMRCELWEYSIFYSRGKLVIFFCSSTSVQHRRREDHLLGRNKKSTRHILCVGSGSTRRNRAGRHQDRIERPNSLHYL